MKLKPKHLEFVLNYLGTKDPAVAYSMVYPNASVQSLSAAASRIMARPEVQDYIQFTERRMEDRLLTQIEAEQEAKKQQLLSINEKRAVLTKIITGETKRVRFIKAKYGPQKVEEDLPVYAVLRAVDMDTRLETFYNILLHRQDWNIQQSRTTYINTPTLQQQVNILISQTTADRHCDEVSARSDTQEATSLMEQSGIISRNAESGNGEPSLLKENSPKQILSHITCPPLTHLAPKKETPRCLPRKHTGFLGGDIGEAPPAREPIGEGDSRNTLAQKNALQLTKVNKNEKPIYNTPTKSTTSIKPGNHKKPCPPQAGVSRSDGGGTPAPEKTTQPLNIIDYNPYTLEPLDPNTDYSYNPNTWLNDEEMGAEAPLPGKITVKPCMKEYD